MAKTTITRTLLRDLPPPPAGQDKVRIFDARLAGFIAERRRNGITYYLRFRDHRRRNREIKLGRLGEITVDQARRHAEQLKGRIAMGEDPAATAARRRAVPLTEEFARDRYLPFVQENLRSADNIEAHLRLRIVPHLGRKALDEVTPTDIAALRRKLIEGGLAADTVNRHLVCVRRLFNLAAKWGIFEGRNPAAAPNMLQETGRDAYLDANQTQALFRALGAARCQDSAAALALLTVTGARKNEVLHARWENLDIDRSILTVPRAKSGQSRRIALSPFAVQVLRRQAARRQAGHPFVFPSPRRPDRPLEDVRGAWARVAKAAGLPEGTRIHDLRHSFASELANLGTPLNEIGVLLGHTQLSTTQRYADHAPQRLLATAATATLAWGLDARDEVASWAA
jgi:integrase